LGALVTARQPNGGRPPRIQADDSCAEAAKAAAGKRRRVDLIELLWIVRTLGADPVDIFAEIVRSLLR
jgi:hypothetical protein